MPVKHAVGLLTVARNGDVTAGFRIACTTISVGCGGGTLSGELLGRSSESCNVGSIGRMVLTSFVNECK